MFGNSGETPVALREDNLGVSLEDTPRHIQQRGDENGYFCSISGDWLEQLSLAEQGAATLHSLSLAHQPVIVNNPAIIIQPAAIIQEDDS